METKIYQGDRGLALVIDCGLDLSAAEDAAIAVRRPDGAEVLWPAEVHQGTALRRLAEPGDFSLPGLYRLQPRLRLGAFEGRGETVELTVYAPFA